MAEFCPRCGTQRTGAFRYCRSCQFDFDNTAAEGAPAQPTTPAQPAAPGPPVQTASIPASVAAGMIELEKLRAILIPFRIGGIVVGLLIWWFVIGPIAGADNPLIVLLALPVLAFLGLYLGNLAGLAFARR